MKKKSAQEIKKEIGDRLREIREARGETGPQVAERAKYDKGNLSKLENGKANPELDTLLAIIVDGLQMEWSEFCTYWSGDEAQRHREERDARQLLEKLLRQGRATRRSAITLLRGLGGGDAEHFDKTE